MKRALYYAIATLLVAVIVLGLTTVVSALLVGLGSIIAFILSVERWMGMLLAMVSTLVVVFSSWVVYRTPTASPKKARKGMPKQFVSTGHAPTGVMH